MASRPKSPARALATLFGLPATLRAWTESLLSTRQQATGSGLMGEADAVGDASAAPPLPPPFGRPKRNGLRAESDQSLQVFGPVRTPPFSRTRLVAGEPPDPVPLGRELQAFGDRAAATRRPGRPQLQARGQPFPHSWRCGSGAASCQPRRSQRVENRRADRHDRPGSRRDAGNRAVSADRPENEAAGCRTTALNESALVLAPGQTATTKVPPGPPPEGAAFPQAEPFRRPTFHAVDPSLMGEQRLLCFKLRHRCVCFQLPG